MTQLTVKQAKALTSAYEKDDVRYYAHQIEFKNGAAVWSDAMKLFRTMVPGATDGQVKVADVKELVQIAKIKKDETITVKLTDMQKYPPYQASFPSEVKQSVTYDINVLMQALKFLKEAGNGYVEFHWNEFTRPVLLEGLEVKEKKRTGDQALVVPVRF